MNVAEIIKLLNFCSCVCLLDEWKRKVNETMVKDLYFNVHPNGKCVFVICGQTILKYVFKSWKYVLNRCIKALSIIIIIIFISVFNDSSFLLHYTITIITIELPKFLLFSEIIHNLEQQKPKRVNYWKEKKKIWTINRQTNRTCVIKCINHLFLI